MKLLVAFLCLMPALAEEKVQVEESAAFQRARSGYWEALARQLAAIREELAQTLKSRAEVVAQEPIKVKAVEEMRKACGLKPLDEQKMLCGEAPKTLPASKGDR